MYQHRTFVGEQPDEKLWVHLCRDAKRGRTLLTITLVLTLKSWLTTITGQSRCLGLRRIRRPRCGRGRRFTKPLATAQSLPLVLSRI